MTTTNNETRICNTERIFLGAFVNMGLKNYPVDRISIFDVEDFFEEYQELPMESITFKGFVKLTSIPEGFELWHLTDLEHSMLFYHYGDGLSLEQLLDKREEAAEAFMHWSLFLPCYQD
jgi:hypothetical protein